MCRDSRRSTQRMIDVHFSSYQRTSPWHSDALSITVVSLVLPQLGSAGFGFVFAGFAGGSATLVNQANYFQLAPASSSWLAT
jgi:hypothetical protein